MRTNSFSIYLFISNIIFLGTTVQIQFKHIKLTIINILIVSYDIFFKKMSNSNSLSNSLEAFKIF